ncbi:TIGR02530 family flagellar biosynthesis protein [Alkalihalobacillus sp. LMS39]|uniref:TIGR02530 family flagellar biosynthesis protein n=1 Tax=Alkalihalobacillus sp. LMS39 TaxID=2924032 RepID=UPI001FB55A95|nr:TIGR02530 family flagellar biosynthesis protein [Alkalihalobacillus sp. LMS39]UOE92834.1 flagellar protein [Alkalihalobacillus sp. LMS39]
METKIHSHHLHQLPKLPGKHVTKHVQPSKFASLLHSQLEQTEELKISKHAQKRMDERGIEIAEQRWTVIEGKLKEAREKGIHDSLVLMEEAALVVSVKNNTVITALDRAEASSQIFTNINGTIII